MSSSRKSSSTSSILGTLSHADFIARYWQQQPLLIREALPAIAGVIDGNDLAGIACEADAEARLILTEAEQTDWQCEQGPFKAKRFKTLPPSHWTLLVQSVDQWIPEIADLLQHFSFLPRWRLDDIMISYATDGGGVGPHFDYYDVFLLQASGTRRWQTGQRCDEHSPLRDHPQMKLLRDFDTADTYDLQTGDMLYLPAGVAHWGTAVGDDCITISIGFRAASQQELLHCALETIAETLPANRRYRDSIAAIDSDTFCINEAAIDNLMAMWKELDPVEIRRALMLALGTEATLPRYQERIFCEKPISAAQLQKKLQKSDSLPVHHHHGSRFAYRDCGDNGAELFIDGEAHAVPLTVARGICHGAITCKDFDAENIRAVLLKLINQGSVFL